MEQKKSTKSTTSSPDATVFTEKRRPVSSLLKSKVFLWGLLVGVLIVATVIGLVLYKQHQDKTGTRVVCSDSLLKTASSQNSDGTVQLLALTIGQVKAQTNFARDPNCLYAVTEYQISSGDMSSAKTSIANLKQKHGKFVFSKSLDGGKASLENLQKQYDIMNNAQQNAKGRIDPTI